MFLNNKGITPKTHSPGLFSWFPMFFPLKVDFFYFIYYFGFILIGFSFFLFLNQKRIRSR